MIVEALISMTDPWKRAFDDRVARVSQHSTRKQARIGGPGQQRAHLEKPCMTQDQATGRYISPSHPTLAGSLHQRVQVDSADGNHQRQFQ